MRRRTCVCTYRGHLGLWVYGHRMCPSCQLQMNAAARKETIAKTVDRWTPEGFPVPENQRRILRSTASGWYCHLHAFTFCWPLDYCSKQTGLWSLPQLKCEWMVIARCIPNVDGSDVSLWIVLAQRNHLEDYVKNKYLQVARAVLLDMAWCLDMARAQRVCQMNKWKNNGARWFLKH